MSASRRDGRPLLVRQVLLLRDQAAGDVQIAVGVEHRDDLLRGAVVGREVDLVRLLEEEQFVFTDSSMLTGELISTSFLGDVG